MVFVTFVVTSQEHFMSKPHLSLNPSIRVQQLLIRTSQLIMLNLTLILLWGHNQHLNLCSLVLLYLQVLGMWEGVLKQKLLEVGFSH